MTPDHTMTTAPRVLKTLVERYLDSAPQCLLCDQPAIVPFVYAADAREGERVRGCVFATCVFCWLGDDFEEHVSEALRQNQCQRQGAPWN